MSHMDPINAIVGLSLKSAGIQINGDRDTDIQIRKGYEQRLFRRVFFYGSLGLGEAYMDGWWDCKDLAGFIALLLQNHIDRKLPNFPKFFIAVSNVFRNAQNLIGAKEVARRHYDMGNDLFENFLDPLMIYTCSYSGRGATNLPDAQKDKLRLTAEKLYFRPGHQVLDIGCGWGGSAKFMAEEFGVHVHAITISEEQYEYARVHNKHPRVTYYLMDYRDAPAFFGRKFNRIYSLGMFEHVGPKNWDAYMLTAKQMLLDEPGDQGIMLLHSILGGGFEPWTHKYIFPNGVLPTCAQITTAAEKQFVIEDVHNFGFDYSTTLKAWMTNLDLNWQKLQAINPMKYDDRMYRMMRYYLLSCAGAFIARGPQLWQMVLSHAGIEGGYRSIR